ncbi:L-cystine-binding protein FliY [Ensifer adhaerens]|nr:L-cystine-binding protein FliY [Ensifer adhaerens]
MNFAKRTSAAIFAAALSCGALFTTIAHADATLDRIKGRGALTVGVILSGAPFGYIDPASQEQKGYNLDIAKALADKLGVRLQTVTVTPPNRVQFLQQGKVDILIANMQYTEERAKILDYVPTPYDRSGGAAVGRKDSGLKDWSDLKGKPVCVSQGSNYTQPLIEQYGAEVKALPSQPESLLALQGGNCVAAVHVGATVGLLLQDRPEDWKDYKILFPTELVPSDSVIWLRKGEGDTSAALDKAILELHANGKLLDYAKANRLLNTTFLEDEHKKLEAK